METELNQQQTEPVQTRLDIKVSRIIASYRSSFLDMHLSIISYYSFDTLSRQTILKLLQSRVIFQVH